MIVSGLVLLAASLSTQDRTAIKEVLPNGATIYLQRIKGATSFSVVLASVPKGEPESPETHGVRHLAEHLIAKGAKRGIDKAIEGQGLVLLASTTRDAMTFQVTGPTKKLGAVLGAIPELLQDFDPTQLEVSREIGIIEQELALRPWDQSVSSHGWLKAYGERAVDPFGEITKLKALTLEDLKSAVLRVFRAESLCVTLAGDFELELQARRLRDLMSPLGKGLTESPWIRSRGAGPVRAGSSDGEAVCVPIGPLGEVSNLTSIGAALGIRAWIPGSVVLVNPSPRNGMVTVGLGAGTSWNTIALRYKGRESLIGRTGLVVLRSWLQESASDPSRLAKIAAVMLPINPSFDPQEIGKLANQITTEDITAAVRSIFVAGGTGS